MRSITTIICTGAWFMMLAAALPTMTEAQDATREVPTRDQIPEKYKWDLTSLYPHVEAWERDFTRAEDLTEKLEKRKGSLAKSPKELLTTLKIRDEASGTVENLYVYAHQLSDQDTGDSKSLALKNRSATLHVSLGEASSWIDPELLTLPEESLRSWCNTQQGLKQYTHYINDVIRQKKHTLSAREEELLAMAGNLASVPQSAYTVLNNAELVWPTVHDEQGQEVTLSHGRFNKFIRSTNRDVRREAFLGQMEAYKRFENTLAAMFNGAIQRDIYFARARGHKTSLEAALFPDNIPPKVYANLVETINRHLPALHRWAALRKKTLKLDELHVYDLYQTIVEGVDKEIEYDDAVETVSQALATLGPEYVGPMNKGFNSNWIDVHETKGKRSGGYSSGSYDSHPYILLNYNKTLSEVSTIAHEMGHAMHSYLTHKHQPRIYGDYTTFVAEVASVTNEILLQDHLLKNCKDRKEKAYLLNHAIDQLRGTVFRQTMFGEFEYEAHRMAEKGEALTSASLGKLYVDMFHKYWGPELVRDSEHNTYWARIPHFYRGFYVYQYATSYCAGAALAKGLLENKPGALDAYLTFLKSGSSEYSLDILRKAGVDMATPKPIEATMDRFEQLVNELEKLLAG